MYYTNKISDRKRSELRFWWLMLTRVNLNAVLVERPERVPEQTRRVILLLELHEAFPIFAERSCDACGWFAASEELNNCNCHRCPYHRLFVCVLTDGKEPPAATGLIVSRSHYEGGVSKGEKIYKSRKNSHVFGGRNTTRVINAHFPLV